MQTSTETLLASQQLWLIPILPLLGFLLNGLFGRRLSKPVVSMIAAGSVLLSFLWVLKTLSALGAFSGGLESSYVEHYYTWIQSGALNISVDFAVDRLTAVMADDRHRRRLPDPRVRHRLHGA